MNHAFWIAWYDLKNQLRERGTLLLMAAVLTLALFGLHQGAKQATASATSAQAAQAQEAAALARAQAYATQFFADPTKPEHAEAKWWRSTADIRGYTFREHLAFAVKPSLAGAVLAIGQSDVLPAYVRVKAESMDSARTQYEIEHPARLASGRFDLSFVVLYIWPLALLTLCLSALTHDRETQRIKTLAIQGVGELQLLTTQVVTRTASASLVLVSVVALSALATGAVPTNADGAKALLGWVLVTLAYSAFWAGVCVLIGALCKTRSTAAFAAFGAWLVLVVLLPNVIAAAATTLAPVPSREAYIVASRDAADAVNADRQNLVARFYDQHPEWRLEKTALDKVSPTVTRLARAIELERKLAAVDASFVTARQNQLRFMDSASVVSPVNLAQHAFSTLAGNDLMRHDAFMAQVRGYQVKLRDFFQAELQLAAKRDEAAPCPTTCLAGFGFTGHHRVPRFVASDAVRSFAKINFDVLWMIGWGVLMFVGAAVALRMPSQKNFGAPKPVPA